MGGGENSWPSFFSSAVGTRNRAVVAGSVTDSPSSRTMADEGGASTLEGELVRSCPIPL